MGETAWNPGGQRQAGGGGGRLAHLRSHTPAAGDWQRLTGLLLGAP